MSRILRRELERKQAAKDTRFQPAQQKILCEFIRVSGSFKVPNRPGFYYVQVVTPEGDSPAFSVFNVKVQARADVKVWVGPGLSGRTEVLDWYNGEVPDIPGYTGSGYQMYDVRSLEWPDFAPGANAVSIYPRAPVPLRVYGGEGGGLTVSVAPLRYVYGNELVTFGGVNNYSLAASQPASGLARYVLVYLTLSTNTIGTANGATATDTPVTQPPFPTFPDGVIPSALIRIDGDQTTIKESDILDVRPHLGEAATGAINAPADAFYFVGAVHDGLTSERVLTFGPSHFDTTDNGAGDTYEVDHAAITTGDLHTVYPLKTLLTFKGSIYVRAAGSIIELPSSLTDGDVLTVNTALSTGIGWAAGPNSASAAAGRYESYIDGTLTTTTDIGPTHIMTGAGEVAAVYIHCKTPGSASSTIVDVNLNGTTIFTTQSNRPTLAFDDADSVAKAAAVEVTTVAENDLLTVDIDQIATGAADLTVLIVVGPSAAVLPESAAPKMGLIEGQFMGQWQDNDYETYGGPDGAVSVAQLEFFGA